MSTIDLFKEYTALALLCGALHWHCACPLVTAFVTSGCITQARTSSLASLAAMAELVAECVSAVAANWDRKRVVPRVGPTAVQL